MSLNQTYLTMDNLFDIKCIQKHITLKAYFEATPGFWSLENLLRRKVTPMAKRMRKRPVVFTICASESLATYCKSR